MNRLLKGESTIRFKYPLFLVLPVLIMSIGVTASASPSVGLESAQREAKFYDDLAGSPYCS